MTSRRKKSPQRSRLVTSAGVRTSKSSGKVRGMACLIRTDKRSPYARVRGIMTSKSTSESSRGRAVSVGAEEDDLLRAKLPCNRRTKFTNLRALDHSTLFAEKRVGCKPGKAEFRTHPTRISAIAPIRSIVGVTDGFSTRSNY